MIFGVAWTISMRPTEGNIFSSQGDKADLHVPVDPSGLSLPCTQDTSFIWRGGDHAWGLGFGQTMIIPPPPPGPVSQAAACAWNLEVYKTRPIREAW